MFDIPRFMPTIPECAKSFIESSNSKPTEVAKGSGTAVKVQKAFGELAHEILSKSNCTESDISGLTGRLHAEFESSSIEENLTRLKALLVVANPAERRFGEDLDPQVGVTSEQIRQIPSAVFGKITITIKTLASALCVKIHSEEDSVKQKDHLREFLKLQNTFRNSFIYNTTGVDTIKGAKALEELQKLHPDVASHSDKLKSLAEKQDALMVKTSSLESELRSLAEIRRNLEAAQNGLEAERQKSANQEKINRELGLMLLLGRTTVTPTSGSAAESSVEGPDVAVGLKATPVKEQGQQQVEPKRARLPTIPEKSSEETATQTDLNHLGQNGKVQESQKSAKFAVGLKALGATAALACLSGLVYVGMKNPEKISSNVNSFFSSALNSIKNATSYVASKVPAASQPVKTVVEASVAKSTEVAIEIAKPTTEEVSQLNSRLISNVGVSGSLLSTLSGLARSLRSGPVVQTTHSLPEPKVTAVSRLGSYAFAAAASLFSEGMNRGLEGVHYVADKMSGMGQAAKTAMQNPVNRDKLIAAVAIGAAAYVIYPTVKAVANHAFAALKSKPPVGRTEAQILAADKGKQLVAIRRNIQQTLVFPNTSELVDTLKKYHPSDITKEFTEEVEAAKEETVRALKNSADKLNLG